MFRTSQHVFKWIAYLVALVVFALLQTGVMPFITVYNVHPNLLPVVPVMVAVLEGGVSGAVFGAVTGLICDALIPPFEGIHTVYLFLACLLIGNLSAALFKKNVATAALSGVAALAVLDILIALLFYFVPRRAGLDVLWHVALPEVALTALFTPLAYLPLRGIHRHWDRGEESYV